MTARLSDVFSGARRILPALALFVLVVGCVLALSGLGVRMTDSHSRNYGLFAIGLAGGFLFTRLLDYVVFDIGYRLRRGTAAPALLRQIVGIVVFAVVLAILLQAALNANLATILTTSAIITAIVGLALQETLGNLFSGLALALERTVHVGDMVRAGNQIGLVEQLSWRAIKVRTMDGNSLLIPNSVASRERLEVFRRGGLPMARTLRVGLEYDAAPARARAELEAAAKDVRGLAAHPSPAADIFEFGDSAVIYELRYWLEDYARYQEVDAEVRERVWYRFERAGLTFAHPLVRQHQYAAGPLRPASLPPVTPEGLRGDLFAPLSAEERQQLARGARRLRFGRGEVVVREGDTTSSMFLIESGTVGISARGEAAASQKVAILEPGAGFGEISLLTGEPRLATARAATEATLIEIDKDTLAPLLRANPSLVEKLDAIILERRRRTADRLDSARGTAAAGEPESLRAKIARFFGLKGLE
ncbi:MAG: mechanosensitive ion channel family protein [Thermoanaerobaculia bacterium]